MSKIDTDQVEGIGDLTALTTTNKNNLVEAVNEVNGKTISSTPMTSISTGVGWYRIATANGGGVAGKSFIVIVERFYNQSNNESYTFSINTAYNRVSTITQISGIANFRAISEIRVVNEVGSNVFVDIFYLSPNINNVRVTVIGNGASALSPTIAPLPTGDVVSLLTTNGIRTTNNIVTDTGFFIKGKSNTDVVLANGDTKPISYFQNNYLDSIITTNGTAAGTVYTFKRVGLSDLTITLTAASASFSGIVTTGAQTFEGVKTFLKSPKVPNATNADEAVNKSQLDAAQGNYLPKSYNSTSAIAVSFIRSSTSAGRFKIRLPYNTNSAKMPTFTIRMYGGYTHTDISCSGYLYATTNQWNLPSAKMIVSHGNQPNIVVDVIFGRDADGRAYVSIPRRGYDGIAILDVVGAFQAGVYGTGWTIIEDDTTPNIGATINVEGLNRLGQLTNDVGYITASALGGYVQQSSLNTQLANYVTLGSVQTITATKTFTVSPIVPNGTLSGHTVNLGQMQAYVASQIPGNSGIEKIRVDNTSYPGPADDQTVHFNFHEYWGFPQAFADETQPGNATAKATQGQLNFFASYDSVQTMIEYGGTADVDMKGYHIVNVLLQSAGGDVYLPDGVYAGDQVNITTIPGNQINIYANNLIATTGNEVRTFANLVWDCELEGWVMTAFGAL